MQCTLCNFFHFKINRRNYTEFWVTASLSILADLLSAPVWRTTNLPLISSLIFRPLGTVQRAPATIGIKFAFMFHSIFCSLLCCKYLLINLFSFIFHFLCVYTLFCFLEFMSGQNLRFLRVVLGLSWSPCSHLFFINEHKNFIWFLMLLFTEIPTSTARMKK